MCPPGSPVVFPGGAGGEGGCADDWGGGSGERDAGRAERARVARTFVGAVLGPGHPCGDLLDRTRFGGHPIRIF